MLPVEIALRNLRVRLVQTGLTVAVVALGVAVALSVLLIAQGVKDGIKRASAPFDMIVGAKGSAMQLVMNTIFLQDIPVGNIPHDLYLLLKTDTRVKSAIPLGLGDNYKGFRIVGTTPDYFEMREKPTAPPYFTLAQGRLYAEGFEVVLGAGVARRLGLKPGDEFTAAHGVVEALEQAEEDHDEAHAQPYKVVGILAPTAGPADLGIYTPIESVWEAHGQSHLGEGGDVTAVLVRPHGLGGLMRIYQEVNHSREAQAVMPGQVFGQLFALMGQGQRAFTALSYVVLFMAVLTVILSLYGTMAERRREVAVLRSLGARRQTVMQVVLWEVFFIGLTGVGLGAGLGHLTAFGVGLAVQAQTGVAARPTIYAAELPILMMVLVLCLLWGLVPALSVYRVEVARNLSPAA